MVDLAKIAKKLKDLGAVVAEDTQDPKDYLSTGNLALDIISDGGIPFGYVVEFLGFSQSGKSLFVQQLIADGQKKFGAVGILIDRENAYTKQRGEHLHIDNTNLILAKPQSTPTITDAFNFLIESISAIRSSDKGVHIVAAIDSISAFSKDVALEKSDTGRKAKSTHEGLREVLKVVDENVMLLVCNQVLYKVGIAYGDPRTSSSGESMKYYSTIRFALEDRHKIIDKSRNDEVIGNWIGVEVIKTRLGPAYRYCYLPHYYATGIDYYGGYIRLLADRGYLFPKNKEKFNKFDGKTVIYINNDGGKEQYQEDDVKKLLDNHPELLFEKYPIFNKTNVKVEDEEE